MDHGYNALTLAQTSVIDVTPNGNEGAIWMAGTGLAGDSQGNIYFLDGNGTFDTTLDANGFPINGDYGNAFIKLSTSPELRPPITSICTTPFRSPTATRTWAPGVRSYCPT